MKLPRDLSGRDLVKALKIFGYEITRQIGTLAGILDDIAKHLEMDRRELFKKLFSLK